jgi:hypothetical protein
MIGFGATAGLLKQVPGLGANGHANSYVGLGDFLKWLFSLMHVLVY